MSLEIQDAFKDQRTVYLINDKQESKMILFNPSPEELSEALIERRRVTAEEWDSYVTKGMRKNKAR